MSSIQSLMNDVIYSSIRMGAKLCKSVFCCCFSKENRVAPDPVGSEDIPAAPRGQLVDLGLAGIIEAARK